MIWGNDLMTSIASLLALMLLPITGGLLMPLGMRRKAATEAFLKRAREIAPLRVSQDYDMVVWHWRFWRWARSLDPSIDDPQLLATSALLKKLDRIWLALALVMLPAVVAVIVWYPWRH